MCVCVQAEPIRVVVTGAAGQIAYSLLYSIAKGDVFGKDQVRLSSGCISGSRPALRHLAAARLHNGRAMNKACECHRDASMPSGWSPAPVQGEKWGMEKQRSMCFAVKVASAGQPVGGQPLIFLLYQNIFVHFCYILLLKFCFIWILVAYHCLFVCFNESSIQTIFSVWRQHLPPHWEVRLSLSFTKRNTFSRSFFRPFPHSDLPE